MQALITSPSRAETWILPNLGSCNKLSIRRRRRKKMWGLAFPVCKGTTSAVLKFGFGCGSLASNCEVNKGKTFVLAWALEEQDVGNETSVEKSVSEDGLVGECGSRDGGMEGGDDEVYGRANGGGGGNWEGKSEVVDVRALALRLQFAKTADDVEEVLKEKGDLPLQVFSSMIRGFGRDKLMDSAFSVVEWLKRRNEETNGVIAPNLFIFNSLLGAVKQSKQFGEMEKVLADMMQEGVEPNIITYNTIMAIYVEQGLSTKALDVLEEVQKKGMIPSPVTYSTTLLAYQRMQDGTGALEFFVEFREKYRNGDISNVSEEDWESEFLKLESFTKRVCYQVMRQWLVMNDNLSINVLKLLIKMDNTGIPLGRAEHERLLWACTREDHYNVAKELYSRIRERHSEISISVCNHVIWLMGKAKKWWAALEIYEDMLDKGPKPNNMSYELVVSHFNVLLTAARKKGIWRWGVRLLNKMEEKGLKPRSKEWNAVLVACSKAAETSAAIQIFRRMVEQGQKPTVLSYGALLSALEKGKLYDEARQVWEHMLKVGVKPNLYVYTIMASVFSGHGKFNLVETILQEMVSSGIEPTVVTYNAIISGCARNDSSSADAFDWFNRMKASNIPPNNVSYEMMIEALAKEGKPRLAYELYLRAQSQGIHLSSKAYDILAQSSVDLGDNFDLKLLGPRPPPHKKENLQSKKSSA
ncbi:protein LOW PHOTOSYNTHETIC EFFICIENCY 1, chloroplastic [Argentina anserina]|uniref:protein LOW PHOTOSYNTHETIC EFFICIENCY 1, chloroplastic n=1 Tax=Argentina anserina TaxID=57926 RepID=UPI00217692CF|nr:protein LOW PHOTOSYNTHETIC EFFICIENCY 1, chloroplastic [Potentilla anserina]